MFEVMISGFKSTLEITKNCIKNSSLGENEKAALCEELESDQINSQTLLKIISMKNCNSTIKAHWFLAAIFAVEEGFTHEDENYYKIRDILQTEEVFNAAMNLTHSVFIANTIDELEADENMPRSGLSWFMPYLMYKNQEHKEEKRYLKWLDEGRATEVLEGTERYLASFPSDEGVFLCNCAARIAVIPSLEEKEQEVLITETLFLIEEALQFFKEKVAFLHYYAALCLISLKKIEDATKRLATCLTIDENFDAAKKLLLLIKKTVEAPKE